MSDSKERALPEHERDDDRTIGGGVLSSGGTAVDRGTGELTGTAQRGDPYEYGDPIDRRTTGGVARVGPGVGPTYIPVEPVDDDDESRAVGTVDLEDER
jgi:hypothetical protein